MIFNIILIFILAIIIIKYFDLKYIDFSKVNPFKSDKEASNLFPFIKGELYQKNKIVNNYYKVPLVI